MVSHTLPTGNSYLSQMKKIFLLLLPVFLLACEDDSVKFPSDLSGEWTLVKATAYESGEIYEIPEKQLIWKINPSMDSVQITNHSLFPGFPVPDGSYSVSSTADTLGDWTRQLHIGTHRHFYYQHDGQHLQLSDVQQPGYHYDFIRPIGPEEE